MRPVYYVLVTEARDFRCLLHSMAAVTPFEEKDTPTTWMGEGGYIDYVEKDALIVA